MSGKRILVVDDEPSIVDAVATALRYEGFEVDEANAGRDALRAVAEREPDLVVLDWMLPDLEGIEVGRRMRERGFKSAILFLTAKDAVENKVEALRAGGDDYVTKPFSLAEIVARVQAILRRTQSALPGDVLRFADLVLDEQRHEVFRGDVRVELTGTEFSLLRYFMLNPRRVLSKSQILQNVWRYDFGGNSNVVETYVSYLRRKLDKLGPPLIKTVRQAGYMLELGDGLMLSRLSLRSRLLLGTIVLAGVGLVAADVATYTSLRSYLYGRVDSTLNAVHPGVESSVLRKHDEEQSPDGGGSSRLLRAAADAHGAPARGDVPGSAGREVRGGAAVSGDGVAAVTPELGRGRPDPVPHGLGGRAAASAIACARRSRAPPNDILLIAAPLRGEDNTLHRLFLVELLVTLGRARRDDGPRALDRPPRIAAAARDRGDREGDQQPATSRTASRSTTSARRSAASARR